MFISLKAILYIPVLNGYFSLWFLLLTFHPCTSTTAPGDNHRLVWVGRDFKDHRVPTPCHGQGLDLAAQSPWDGPQEQKWDSPTHSCPMLCLTWAAQEGTGVNTWNCTPKVRSPSLALTGQREKKPSPASPAFCSLRESHKYKTMKTISPAAKAMKQFVREMTFLMRNTCWRRTKGPVWSERCSWYSSEVHEKVISFKRHTQSSWISWGSRCCPVQMLNKWNSVLMKWKEKKRAFLNQNPCTRVFHILKEEKEKTKKEKGIQTGWKGSSWTWQHCPWDRLFLITRWIIEGDDNLDLQNTKIWLCRLFFLALLCFSLTVIWLWLHWVCSLRRDRFCKLLWGQKLLERSGVTDRFRISNCKTTINICLHWQRAKVANWNDTSFFPEFWGGQVVWCLSSKSFWNKRSDQYQLSR